MITNEAAMCGDNKYYEAKVGDFFIHINNERTLLILDANDVEVTFLFNTLSTLVASIYDCRAGRFCRKSHWELIRWE